MSETTTTTEVVEALPSRSISTTKYWKRWSFSNLQGLLPFLPKVPGQKESIGFLQRLSPAAIKSECILTGRSFPSSSTANQSAQTRVQTIRGGASLPSENNSDEKEVVVSSTFSVSFTSLALLTGLSNLCPEFLKRPQVYLEDEVFLTTLAVYSGIMVLMMEGSACLLGLLAGSMPPGLVFMVVALLMMAGIACMTIGHDPNAPHHALLSPTIPQRNLQKER